MVRPLNRCTTALKLTVMLGRTIDSYGRAYQQWHCAVFCWVGEFRLSPWLCLLSGSLIAAMRKKKENCYCWFVMALWKYGTHKVLGLIFRLYWNCLGRQGGLPCEDSFRDRAPARQSLYHVYYWWPYTKASSIIYTTSPTFPADTYLLRVLVRSSRQTFCVAV